MNFHTYHQAGKPWRTTEELALINLRRKGLIVREIAKELGRTIPSIKDRVKRLQRRSTLDAPVAEPKLVQFIEIEFLPNWYALGWKVHSFDKCSCVLEWPHKSEPRRP